MFVTAILILQQFGVFGGRRYEPPIPVSGPFAGRKADILQGEIPVPEMLRFLADYSGLEIVWDKADARIATGTVVVISPIEEADGDVVRALLENEGLSVRLENSPGGDPVLRVQSVKPPGR